MRKPAGKQDQDEDSADSREADRPLHMEYTRLREALMVFKTKEPSDNRLAKRFNACHATLRQRIKIVPLKGNKMQVVIDPPCTPRQQAAIIEIAHRLTEKRGRHPVLETLRAAFTADPETYAVLEMAEEHHMTEIDGLNRVYGDFGRVKDRLLEKVVLDRAKEKTKTATPPQTPS